MSGSERQAAPLGWEAVMRRLEAARYAPERGWIPDEEAAKAQLRTRATELAREPGARTASESIEVLVFQLANQQYALETEYIREVQRIENLTPIPCTPPFVAGIVSVRGEIVSVINLNPTSGRAQADFADRPMMIVLQSDAIAFAIFADVIIGADRVMVQEIRALTGGAAITNLGVRGVTGSGLVVLDAASLLADEKMIVEESVERPDSRVSQPTPRR